MRVSYLPWWRKLKTIITLALLLPLLLLSLQGCSTLRLAYGNAPTAAYWYLDSYLDFNDAQAPAVRSALAQIHRWHQQTQLPAYVQTLNRLQAQVAHDITPEQACTIYSQVQDTLVDTGEGMADILQAAALHPAGAIQVAGAGHPAAILTTLDARQLQHLERKFTKSNAEYRKDFMDGSPARQREKRLERTVSRVETFYGQLDKRQQDLLADRLAQSGWQPELAYAERVRRQQDLLQTLKAMSQGSAATKDASLKAVLARWAESPDARYREQSQAVRLRSCDMLAALHNSTSAKQRQNAAAALQSYVQDLQAVRKS